MPRGSWGKRIAAILFLVVFLQILRLFWGAFWPEQTFCNAGGPFGSALPFSLLLLSGALAFVFLGVQWHQGRETQGAGAWLLILSGGASNLGERLAYGCVTDYFHFIFFFNLADVFLTFGVAGLLWQWYDRRVTRHEI